ncbi:MAG TPA: histidine kinase [Streptomyces sp.]|uniref:sensor histidine kinase n=1 Tax=Streptomyces sp. TaxID=1931 RepID=UPI002D506598|nr:histidine kinase [Streptomyces sp.]HZG03378.1 histidine kinase [Streptomyces sp.]
MATTPTDAPPRPAAAPGSAEADAGVPEPAVPIQVNALQAMCRQVFLFRLAMVAVSTPIALGRTADGPAAWLVGGAVLVTFMGSYVPCRDWERFGPLLLRHPVLLGVDTLFGALLLVTATPGSPLGYAVVCTPLLAGLMYGPRGAGVFAALQLPVLGAAYAAHPGNRAALASALLLAGFCLLAGTAGVTVRNLLFRFGEATRALAEARARLAVGEAVEQERSRLARELHDSVAKTLHGLALAADALAESAHRMDPSAVRHRAGLVARSARRAAAESRELLSDLRGEPDPDGGVDIVGELSARTADFARRTGLHAVFRPPGAAPVPPVPSAAARHVLTIVSEAMENAHRHARPTRLEVSAGVTDGTLRISVRDDGRGLPPDTDLDRLRHAGRFGLVGMVERAAAIGARLRIGRGRAASGTEVRLDLPLAALPPPGTAATARRLPARPPRTAPRP